jgi:hypothetical protein
MKTRISLLLSTLILLSSGGLAADEIEKLDAAKVPKVKAPAKAANDLKPWRIRVLVLEFNPLIPGKVYAPDDPKAEPKRLREVAGWNDPLKLAEGYMQDLCDASGGLVQYEIVEWDVVNEFQKKTDGFSYTPEEYMACRGGKSKWHDPDGTDYPASIKRHKLASRVESGEVDEVWWFGAPYMGWWESCMAGKGAFEVNGGVYDQVPCKRRFVIMGFNYERGVDCMLEDFCHRAEATMSRTYGGWRAEKLDTTWAKFAANEKQSGTAAVGTCHYPPNGEADYDYANKRVVQSTADDWLTYPKLTGAKQPVNCETWAEPHKGAKGQPDYHRNYIRWWFAHVPKAPGVNEDGRLNNWWEYQVNFNSYDERGKPLPEVKPVKDEAAEKAGLRRPA